MMGATASESAYRVLMGVLESRTGQTLSPNRIWRIEMSLKPVMQRFIWNWTGGKGRLTCCWNWRAVKRLIYGRFPSSIWWTSIWGTLNRPKR